MTVLTVRTFWRGCFCAMLLGSLLSARSAALADTLLVAAVVSVQPVESALATLHETGCGEAGANGELRTCTAAWTRYRLSKVTTLDGASLADITVLLYTESELAGPRLLELQSLSDAEAVQYGATYKASRSTTLFSGACFDQPLQLPDNAAALGPTQIQEFGAAQCYLMPLWWAR